MKTRSTNRPRNMNLEETIDYFLSIAIEEDTGYKTKCLRLLNYRYNAKGYLQVWFEDKAYLLTRLILEHRLERKLVYGMDNRLTDECALHHCDQRFCINPDHLFLGTRTDNAKDRDRKDRQARGETQGSSKLTEKDVLEIRKLRSLGVTQTELGIRFGTSQGNIWHIVHHSSWKHI